MDGATLTLVLFGLLFATVLIGVPIAFALGIVAIVVGFLEWGPFSAFLLSSQVAGALFNQTLIALPFFMFMASVLDRAGIAEDLYAAMHLWMGALRGGLAVGTVLACAGIAAMSGVSAVGVMAMGRLALPAMLGRGYDKGIALGVILAGGALGQLIPPSLIAIVYSGLAGVSIGQMFLAGIGPGLLLTTLFCVYVLVRAGLDPRLAPALPKAERAAIGRRERLVATLKVAPAILVVLAVLGSMFAGLASPTEAAAVGAATSLLVAVLQRRLRLADLATMSLETGRQTAMVMWIAINALLFVAVYSGIGGEAFIRGLVEGLALPPTAIVLVMMAIVFALGFVMDPIGILFLTMPIFIPIVEAIGFDPILFGGLVILNLEMAYLTPPFGYNLFYLKSVAPPSVTLADLYRAAPAFVALQALGLAICWLVPEIVTGLPQAVLGR
ncbi:TRAP transporter large permease [Salinarimonas ramus]|uniref:TRAP transporter large permease protein n=1 Tax=Salinarimonas ramus TaxID=690164 RepID=A0A917Q9H1_9HYPH|nr:TRAP transporter large permease subunit [Salinarimonas ramus]GGK37592.1 tripartite transporter large subunit [Salinarimonas ramus]